MVCVPKFCDTTFVAPRAIDLIHILPLTIAPTRIHRLVLQTAQPEAFNCARIIASSYERQSGRNLIATFVPKATMASEKSKRVVFIGNIPYGQYKMFRFM